MTQLQEAKKGEITKEMRKVAREEGIDPEDLREKIKRGLVVIPANRRHRGLKPIGIGKGLRVKVNVNIGTSPVRVDRKKEVEKLKMALEGGTDTIMDLSTGGDIDKIRRTLIKKCPCPFGTVPIYQAVVESKGLPFLTLDRYLQAFEKQARDGVDFATVHAGVTKRTIPLLKKRVIKSVSRGGSLLLKWMTYHGKENFLYQYFDRILEIAAEYDVTLSLGDGLRPGCLADATDKAQIEELKTLGELAKRARRAGVQVMIEGPGHIPLSEIEENVKLEKRYCHSAPFYVLGPLPTDIGAGYDHIGCAIGGALAGALGADFLCYVTPKEHIGLPEVEDVREGVVVTKLAAHIADIARGNKKAILRDKKMARARARVDWEEMGKYVLDQKRFWELVKKEFQKNPQLKKRKECSMCGPFCALS